MNHNHQTQEICQQWFMVKGLEHEAGEPLGLVENCSEEGHPLAGHDQRKPEPINLEPPRHRSCRCRNDGEVVKRLLDIRAKLNPFCDQNAVKVLTHKWPGINFEIDFPGVLVEISLGKCEYGSSPSEFLQISHRKKREYAHL